MKPNFDSVFDPKAIAAQLAEQRALAKQELKETGSISSDWDFGIKLWDKGVGRPSKYNSPDELLNHGIEYFKSCSSHEQLPARSGLILWLGFASNAALIQWTRTNPEYRPVFGTLMLLLQVPLEMMLGETGVNTQGLLFRLKNIPDGLLPSDPAQSPVRYDWKERKATELTGVDGAALVEHEKLDPEEVYKQMLSAGARLKGGQEPGADCPQDDLPSEG